VTGLAAQVAQSSPEHPWSVAYVSGKLQAWIERLGSIWVEGEVIQYHPRPGAGMQFFTLRDLNQQSSLDVSVFSSTIKASGINLERGSKVILFAKPNYYAGNGRLSLRATEIRAVGVGDLLARLEQLKNLLSAEGLFDSKHKLPLPFLPKTIGLVTGRNSDAMHDVVNNVRLRWPAAEFVIHEVAVQGTSAVPEVKAALAALDAHADVDVIVIARGGGGIEDLLPFSDEGLVRAVFAAGTPVVSAIGHERDNPLLDFVADLRASTPTDAAKRVVPDVEQLRTSLIESRRSMRRSISNSIEQRQFWLDDILSRPVVARPTSLVDAREAELARLIAALRHRFEARILKAGNQVGELTAKVRALSPLATLQRGYAVVRLGDGQVVRSVKQVGESPLSVSLADGTFAALPVDNVQKSR
jgi:exodeoxyribonuclease VII large subunit